MATFDEVIGYRNCIESVRFSENAIRFLYRVATDYEEGNLKTPWCNRRWGKVVFPVAVVDLSPR